MNTPNDTVLARGDKKTTHLKCPTMNEKEKKDITPHQKKITRLQRLSPSELYRIDRRRFAKSYLMTHCPVCGHTHPISRYEYNKIKAKVIKEWARNMNNKLTAKQRKNRAIKAGIARAIKAGQTLKPSTIQKCTGRGIQI
jgi:hypothetical protein